MRVFILRMLFGLTIAASIPLLGACDRPALRSVENLEGTLSGKVMKGAVGSAVITAYEVNSRLERLGAVKNATATTEEDGSFRVPITGYHGAMLLVVTGGSFTEEAAGTAVKLDGSELSYLMLGYEPEAIVENILVSPISHLAYGLASRYVRGEKMDIEDASQESWRHLNQHFGGMEWRFGGASDPSMVEGAHLDDEGKRGLLLAGLSMVARSAAETNDLTPGGRLNSLVLLKALFDDVSHDGYFDGVSPAGRLFLPPSGGPHPQRIDGQTLRLTLALGVQRFLKSDRNLSAITPTESLQLREELASSTNPRIFRDDGAGYDDAPPVLSLAGEGPSRYTQNASATFAVIADDGAGTGVGAVLAANREGAPVAGVLEAGVWTFTVPLVYGKNRIEVWAEDNAAPPNVGRGKDAPSSLIVEVTRDDSRPALATVPVSSYFDERALEIGQADGVPLMPADFRFPAGAAKVSTHEFQEIFKSSVRLSWGPSKPEGTVLEGTNPFNVPFIQYEVAFNSESDAPVGKAYFDVRVTCAGCPEFPVRRADMIPSPRTGEQRTYFDLPLAVETVEDLAAITSSPAILTIDAFAEDAAGNVGRSTSVLNVRFHVIGPPLAWKEEVTYSQQGDPQSIHPYRLSNATYHDLWRGRAELGRWPRLIKYTVRNPYPRPIAIKMDGLANATWSSAENWDDLIWRHSTQFYVDGFYFGMMSTWRVSGQGMQQIPAHPCLGAGNVASAENYVYAVHNFGTSYAYGCPSGPFPDRTIWQSTPPPVVASGPATPLAFVNPMLSGNERELAPVITDNAGARYFFIPAATDNAPGAVTVYLTRPLLQRSYRWNDEPDPAAGTPGYQVVLNDYWRIQANSLNAPITFDCDCHPFTGCAKCSNFLVQRTVNHLFTAKETVSGSLTLQSSAIRPDGFALGGLRDFGVQPVSSTFWH